MVVRLLVFKIFFLMSIISFAGSQSLYKYAVTIDHIEVPEKDLLFDFGTARVKKFNRTQTIIDGYVDLLRPATDEMDLHVNIFSEHGNDYKKIVEYDHHKMCTRFRSTITPFLQSFLNTTTLDRTLPCPWPTQRIYFNNSHFPTDRLPVEPIMRRGKLTLVVSENGIFLSNFTLYFVLEKQGLF